MTITNDVINTNLRSRVQFLFKNSHTNIYMKIYTQKYTYNQKEAEQNLRIIHSYLNFI